jgi:hypothetical protein
MLLLADVIGKLNVVILKSHLVIQFRPFVIQIVIQLCYKPHITTKNYCNYTVIADKKVILLRIYANTSRKKMC